MTLAQAEKITGLQFDTYRPNCRRMEIRCYAVSDEDPSIREQLFEFHCNRRGTETKVQFERRVAQAIVDRNYQRNSEIVRLRQAYRCARCAQPKPLQIHHKVHRGQGRDDRVSNLIGECQQCHDLEHRTTGPLDPSSRPSEARPTFSSASSTT